MKIKTVKLHGQLIVTVPNNGNEINYVCTGATKKDCLNQFYATLKRLKGNHMTPLKVWSTKPQLTPVNEPLQVGAISINPHWRLTSWVYINPIINTITGEPVKVK